MSFHDRAETMLVWMLAALFKALPPEAASNLGGALLGLIGPLLPRHKTVVLNNIRRAMPELDAATRARIGRQSWENLGRVLAELVHLPRILNYTEAGAGLELMGSNILTDALNASAPAIFFSAHLANWEILLPQGSRMGASIAGIYRAPQRSGVDQLLSKWRHLAAGKAFPLFPKGAKGGRDAFAWMRGGGQLAVLMDQKLNEGVAVPFFGIDAMTAPAAAKFALHFRGPLVPVHTERLGPARYRMIAEPALILPETGDADTRTREILAQINQTIERWVRARPENGYGCIADGPQKTVRPVLRRNHCPCRRSR